MAFNTITFNIRLIVFVYIQSLGLGLLFIKGFLPVLHSFYKALFMILFSTQFSTPTSTILWYFVIFLAVQSSSTVIGVPYVCLMIVINTNDQIKMRMMLLKRKKKHLLLRRLLGVPYACLMYVLCGGDVVDGVHCTGLMYVV